MIAGAGLQLVPPKSALQALQSGSKSQRECCAGGARRAAALAACGELLRQRVLHIDEELLVLDKPAGLPVQGGPGGAGRHDLVPMRSRKARHASSPGNCAPSFLGDTRVMKCL